MNVDAIDRQWQEDAEPWEHKLVSRIHYKVTLEDGRRRTVFGNMDHGWGYRASVYFCRFRQIFRQ